MKVVHFNLYDPASGLHLFGKPSANTPTEYQYIECENCDNCQLFKQGQCAMTVFLGKNCPYGKYRRVIGPTKRAKSFRTWQQEARKQYEGVPYLKSPPEKLAVVGEYVYVPYAHMNMNKELSFSKHSALFVSGTNFLKLADFTIPTITSILDFVPRDIMSYPIHSYRKEVLPKFLAHLEEVFPGLYNELLKTHPEYINEFGLNRPKNYIGRKALVRTLAPCSFETKGSRDGKYRVRWVWDGQKLTTNSEHAYNGTWGDIDHAEKLDLTLVPSDKSVVVITDNAQVAPSTVFMD